MTGHPTARRRPPRKLLVAVAAYTVVAVAILTLADGLPTVVRVVLGLPLFLFAPGFAVVTALFPTADVADYAEGPSAATDDAQMTFSLAERAVVSVLVSLGVVPMVALAANAVASVAADLVLVGLAIITVGASLIAVWRLPGSVVRADSTTGTGSSDRDLPWILHLTNPGPLLVLVVVVSLLGASAALAFTGGDADSTRTEFYLADQDTDGNGTYEVRVKHHDDERHRYTIVVRSGPGTELESVTRAVDPGAPATFTYRPATQRETVEFLLYRGSDAPAQPSSETAHRRLVVHPAEVGG